jgi:tRNA pseudouridine38-40 synthase
VGEPTPSDPAAPATEGDVATPTTRVALGIAYDGSGFHGFAVQPGQRTVAGELAAAIGRVLGDAARIVCAGRTDAGVHARAQVAHVDLGASTLRARFSLEEDGRFPEIPELARALSALCGPEIAVWRAIVAPRGFDARHSATARRYRYEIDTGRRPDPLRRTAAWHVPEPLDLAAMRIATDVLLGEHDFSGFCRRPANDDGGPMGRRVIDAHIDATREGVICFEIEANAFCHQMVRSIVGTLVAAGRGTRRPSEMMRLLEAKSREGAVDPAPPYGLYLIAVRYPDVLTGTWR